MTIKEAAELVPGDRVRWDTRKDPKQCFTDGASSGTIIKRVGSAVEIRWDDGKYICVGTIEGDHWRDEWWRNCTKLTPLKEFTGKTVKKVEYGIIYSTPGQDHPALATLVLTFTDNSLLELNGLSLFEFIITKGQCPACHGVKQINTNPDAQSDDYDKGTEPCPSLRFSIKMKSNQITTGARVRFTARGREITGTVTGYKYTTPGARMDIVKLGLVPIIRHRKLEVLPDEGGGIWTVSEHSCKCVGRAKDSTEALLKATELKSFVKQQRQKRYSENTEICNERGLFELKKGDKILVEFRGGRKLECRFDKLTGAGMVGFYRDGDNVFDSLGLTKTPRVRFTAPKYVTKI